MPDLVGWLATAIFAISYFCKRTTTLRRVQGIAALAWATYGVLIHSLPIIVANVIVASLAFGSSLWQRPVDQPCAPRAPPGAAAAADLATGPAAPMRRLRPSAHYRPHT